MSIETLIVDHYKAEITGFSKEIGRQIDAEFIEEFISGIANDQSTSDFFDGLIASFLKQTNWSAVAEMFQKQALAA